jgi:hypothetical protein
MFSTKKKQRKPRIDARTSTRRNILADYLKAPPPPLDENDLYIGPSSIDPKGKGLFSNKDILKKMDVVGFDAERLTDGIDYEKFLRKEKDWPIDAGIHALNGFWYDKNFSNASRPKWYYLNHAYPKPLLKLRMARNHRIVWSALQEIPAHTELTFAYDNKEPKKYFRIRNPRITVSSL